VKPLPAPGASIKRLQGLILLLLAVCMPSRLRSEWGPFIPADHPALRWEGRVRIADDHSAVFDWASVRLHLAFKGRGLAVYGRLGQNYLDVFVDGDRVAILGRAPRVPGSTFALQGVEAGDSKFGPVFEISGLNPGRHEVVIAKRTSPNFGPATLLGLSLDQGATLLQAPPAPSRRLEFVGDSLTNGYGDEGTSLQCAELPPFENSSRAWARLSAEALSADAQVLAYSGYGLVRNYAAKTKSSDDPVPLYYPRTVLAENKGLWDRAAFRPDATLVFLGTNDHSTQPQPDAADFIGAYHSFLAVLRKGRPGLPILILYPDDASDLSQRVQQVAAEEQAKGKLVEALGLPQPDHSELGCDWHPKAVVQARWSKQVIAKLKKMLNW